MKAYLDNGTYTMYAQEGDIIIGDIMSAALGLQALHLELKEVKVYSTVVNVETQYFHNSFLHDEEEYEQFRNYVTAQFEHGMSVTICRNRLIVYYGEEEYFITNHNLQIESVKITVY